MALWGVEVRCQVMLLNVNFLMMRSVDGSARLDWKTWALVSLLGLTNSLHVAAR